MAITLMFSLVAGASAWGQSSTAPPVPLPPEVAASAPVPEEPVVLPASSGPVLEETRRMLRTSSEWLARTVDGWFGDQPFENGGKVSNGRAMVGIFKREDQNLDFDLRFNARFRLPNMQQRSYFFIGRDDEREAARDTPQSVRLQQQLQTTDRNPDRSFFAGLGFSVLRDLDVRVGFAGAAKPYAQLQYDRPWVLSEGQLLDFRETVFYTRADKLGSASTLTYDLALGPRVALRWANALTITQASRNYEWSSNLATYVSFGFQRLFTLEGLLTGEGTRGTGVGQSDRGVLVRWEQPLYRDWVQGEAVLGHFWPRPDARSERGNAWALGFNLKMQF